MRIGIKNFLTNILITLLIFSMGYGNRSLFALGMPNPKEVPFEEISDPVEKSKSNVIIDFFNKKKLKSALNNQKPGNLPSDSNPFGLVYQEITYTSKGQTHSFDLSTENVLWHNSLIDPPLEIGKKVKIEIINGDLHLSFKGYTQIIEKLDLQTFTRDNELLTLISKNGDVWAINIAKLHDFIFKGPIPVFKTAKLNKVNGTDTLQFITANFLDKKPYPVSSDLVDKGLSALITGDIAVISDLKIVEILPRESIMDSIVSQTILLKLLTLITDGKGVEANQLIRNEFETIREIIQNKKESGFLTNSDLMKQLQKLPRKTLDNILNEIRTYKQHKRHAFTTDEWQNFSENTENYLNVKPEEEKNPKNLLKDSNDFLTKKMKRAFTPENLSKLAATFKMFILSEPPQIACKFMHNIQEACTAVWMGSSLWDTGTKIFDLARSWVMENTPLLLGKTYIFYNTLSTLSLYSMFAAVLVTGAVGGYFTNKTMNKAIATVGLRFIAYTVGWLGLLPFKILRQHNLPLASENRIFSKNSLNAIWANQETIEKKRKLLLDEIAAKKNLRTNAMIIAYAIIAERTQTDPATLILHNIGVFDDKTQDLSPSQIQKWITLSKELENILPSFSSKNIFDLSGEEIANAFELAKEVEPKVDKILESPWYNSLLKLKSFGKYLIDDTPMKVLKSFPTPMKSYKFYKKLKYAEIDDFTANISMNKFKVELAFLPFFYGWLGAYANPMNPTEKLACNPDCFMWTNPRIRSEMMEQIFLAVAPRPAMRYLVFGTSNNTPFEYEPLVLNGYVQKNKYGEIIIPKNRRETIPESIRSYVRHGLDFHKAQYGTKFLRTFETMIETINSSYFSGLFLRTVGSMGGITLQQAFFSLAYMKAMSTWYFGWILIFSIRALQLHEEELGNNYQYFLNLISDLDKNIRFGDFNEASFTFKKLIDLYPQDKLPYNLNKNMILETVDSFQKGLASNDKTAIDDFLSLTQQITTHAQETPPVPAAPHKFFMSLVNGLTTGVMTLIATYLTLDSYNVTGMEIIKAYGLTIMLYTGAFWGLNTVIPNTLDYFDRLSEPKPIIFTENKKIDFFQRSISNCKNFFKLYNAKKIF